MTTKLHPDEDPMNVASVVGAAQARVLGHPVGHTPGPWRYNSESGAIETDTVMVAALGSVNEEANARLIEQAPELLGALRALIEDPSDDNHVAWRRARAAIAKAEGRGTD